MRDSQETLGREDRRPFLLLSQLLSLTLCTGLFVVILVPGPWVTKPQRQEVTYRRLTELKAGVARLCRRCPWDWTLFQGKCYFLSKSTRTWNDSAASCQEMAAQLVIIETEEEQSFLRTSLTRNFTWIGLSDLRDEGQWLWVDGSPLPGSFNKYWNQNEPNNYRNQDCVEFKGDGWNDSKCTFKKFWICEKPADSCPGEGWSLPSAAWTPRFRGQS